ncbi:FAD-binding oxidoreductase [Micromonospora aurantiaca]|uniref:NAD(P)/FAD-dependent oxidoreductase n=1 Tax=Micromonospora aurantiaca (nom. illeg.) TaxID=47850 RepID=UPI000F3C44CB|nr:FAD-dependent oxidoreductase [Micromonospora aurantiaca]RNH97597.1 FAD-binding oxidoreductase [Micromonospora aurantiaca]
MSENLEVVVVGAGMFGSAAAKYLARAGLKVLLIGPAEPGGEEAFSQYAFSAHFDEARITRRLGWDAVWGTTDARSMDRFRDIEAESGVEFFRECGSLVVLARSIAHRTDSMLDQCRRNGIPVERMSEDAMRRSFPELGILHMAGGTEGLYEATQAGYINPRRLVAAQIALAATAGAQVRRAAVTAVEKDVSTGSWRLGIDDGTVVHTQQVLLATGAFTNHNNVLPGGRRLAIHAFTEPNLLFEVDGDQLDRMRSLPTVVTVDPADTGDANLSLYLLPPILYPDGRWYLRIGPGMQPFVEELRTVEAMASWYAKQQITPRQWASLTNLMQQMVPDVKPVSVRAAGCIIEKTPSRYPYLGHLDDDPTISVAIGGNGHGARGSDEIGRLAALTVLGERWDCPIDQAVFAPIYAEHDAESTGERPDFLKPPFGLC